MDNQQPSKANRRKTSMVRQVVSHVQQMVIFGRIEATNFYLLLKIKEVICMLVYQKMENDMIIE